MQKLIFSCDNNDVCMSGKSACEIMNSTLKEISENSWKVGEDTPIKGYQLRINSDETEILDRKSTRLNSSHIPLSRMPSSA